MPQFWKGRSTAAPTRIFHHSACGRHQREEERQYPNALCSIRARNSSLRLLEPLCCLQSEISKDTVCPGALESQKRFKHTGLLVEPAVLRGRF